MNTNGVAETPSLLCNEFGELKNRLVSLHNTTNEKEFPSCVGILRDSWEIFFKEYSSEGNMIQEFGELLAKLIDHFKMSLFFRCDQPASKEQPRIKSDLCIFHKNSGDWIVPLVILEGKRAYGITKSDQDIQVASYYAHFFASTLPEDRTVSSTWPTVLITRVRGHFRIMGAYTLVRFCSDEKKNKPYHLVETLGTFDVTKTNIIQVAKMFELLFEYIGKIHKFRQTLHNVCYPNCLPTAEYIMFPNKLVYISDTKVIKFVKTYSKGAHEYAHSLNIAPSLRSFNILPSGYYHVEMDLVKRSDQKSFHAKHWQYFVQQMEIFNQKFVHGDLREDNIIYSSENGYQLVDFDWSGLIYDEPKYPLFRNHKDIRWPEDSVAGGVIKPSHDQFMLNELEQKLKATSV